MAQHPYGKKSGQRLLSSLDDASVKITGGFLASQYRQTEQIYNGLSNDRILHGFRKVAGRPAPGEGLTGWCASDSSVVFGQWISALSRFGLDSGGDASREKAVELHAGWAELNMLRYERVFEMPAHHPHYSFEKLMCGLVDLYQFGGVSEAVESLSALVEWGSANLDRERQPATDQTELGLGRPLEWYTLSENSYRAYELTGDEEFRNFGDIWCYDQYWSQFADSAAPTNVTGVHAYSHLNTFSGAAMRYLIEGDERYLQMVVNCHDFFQQTQCYATGGYGPAERLVPPGGHLGRSLDTRSDSFEAPCGSWAAFKLCKYLIESTAQARFGDWMEKVLYNGIGAALPPTGVGDNFYYADYRPSGGMKTYDYNRFACCSGTYAQAVAEYRRLIYFQDGTDLFVNLFLPSKAEWVTSEGRREITVETKYPMEGLVDISMRSDRQADWTLKVRVPEWSGHWGVTVNGEPVNCRAEPGSWLELNRTWGSHDNVRIEMPLEFREVPVDAGHPQRIALVRGAVVYVLDAGVHERYVDLPSKSTLQQDLIREDEGDEDSWRVMARSGEALASRLRPFYAIGEGLRYRMYIDRDRLPISIW